MDIPFDTAKRRLGVLWLVGGGILFFVLVLQSVFEKYGAKTEAAWQWFLPTILPTVSLIVAVFVVQARTAANKKAIDKFYFQIAFWPSVSYLAVVAITIYAATALPLEPNFELLNRAHLYLAPLQGLTSAALGIFFIKKP